MRSRRVAITITHEFELTMSASVSPGSPEVRDVESPFCGPASGPEVEDVRVDLTSNETQDVRALLGAFYAKGQTKHEDVEYLVGEILGVIEGSFPPDKDSEFMEEADRLRYPDQDE